ncbi:hypothetical protein GGR17_001626 [Confluentimicrobium naphthalenivorans]|uniref:Uncharacterized protein n=1 Tax=Actibacterium naphthalenivorans TaxID=1614693 RepID=A0A840C8S6_9RHOB|nr:hypothetical protein [Actibacterium naphthalenivorans]
MNGHPAPRRSVFIPVCWKTLLSMLVRGYCTGSIRFI